MQKPKLTCCTKRREEALASAVQNLYLGGGVAALFAALWLVFGLDLIFCAIFGGAGLAVGVMLWHTEREGASKIPTDEEVFEDLERIAREEECGREK